MNANLQPNRGLPTASNVTLQACDLVELAVRNRMAQALHDGTATYPIYRHVQIAARTA
jgi:hypothetical protein